MKISYLKLTQSIDVIHSKIKNIFIDNQTASTNAEYLKQHYEFTDSFDKIVFSKKQNVLFSGYQFLGLEKTITLKMEIENTGVNMKMIFDIPIFKAVILFIFLFIVLGILLYNFVKSKIFLSETIFLAFLIILFLIIYILLIKREYKIMEEITYKMLIDL